MRQTLVLIALAAFASFGQRPVVLVTDCGNWVDDQLAIIRLLAAAEIEIKGIIASQYGAPGTEKSAFTSVNGLLKQFSAATIPVWHGAEGPLKGSNPTRSEGATKLVELAKAGPISVLCLSAATDVASAILMDSASAKNISVTWVGGGPIPKGGRGDFNLANDVTAARVLFDSAASLAWIPAAGAAEEMRITGKELASRFGEIGKAGVAIKALAESAGGGGVTLWDLAAVEIFLRPGLGYVTSRPAPIINDDYTLSEGKDRKGVVTYTGLKKEQALADFEKSLQAWARRQRENTPGG